MSTGKLYRAEIRLLQQGIRAACCCCHAPLEGSEVIREEEAGNRTTFIVRCPNCSRYMMYYRKEAA